MLFSALSQNSAHWTVRVGLCVSTIMSCAVSMLSRQQFLCIYTYILYIYLYVCVWREAAMPLWMLISSGLWWCHTLWCHTRGEVDQKERRGGRTDKGIAQTLTAEGRTQSHAWPGHLPHSKVKRFVKKKKKLWHAMSTYHCSPAQLSLVVMATATGPTSITPATHTHTHIS